MSRMGRLAEGEEPGSNTLFCEINGLQTTQLSVGVAWRILRLLWRPPIARGRYAACEAVFDPDLEQGG
jgi:hypothetical protein